MKSYKASLTIMGLVFLAILMNRCTQDEANDLDLNGQFKQEASDKALAIFPGNIREIQSDIEEGVPAWKFDIVNEKGAEVEIYCNKSDGGLLRIDGESGPFDYNINPGNSFISFTRAKEIASAEINEDLEKWRFRKEDKFDFQWVYTLEYINASISIDGEGGSVLEIEN